VYCTKVGTTHPDQMYIVGGHMDGIGWGEAANDDGAGTARVTELARVLSAADERTERDPQWHQPTDRYATYGEKDFRLGLNTAQTTLGAVARLAGAVLTP
jgi:Zn-dependent M28 family amino/carboxypeptidase